jgi:uncharacterized protein
MLLSSMGKFKEKIIAIVGVSESPGKYGYKIFNDLLKEGYNIFGINPKGNNILGQTIYPNLSELPYKPDLVITVVPPAITEIIIEECKSMGIKTIWMQPGSESQEAINKAKGYGIDTIQACFMVMNGIWH